MRGVVGLGIIALGCVGLAVVCMTRQVAANELGTVKPFTATVSEVKFNSNGVARHRETYVVGFRADGSNVTDYHRTLPNGQTSEVKMVEDVKAGRRVAVDYPTESTSTYPLPSNYSAMMARLASACGANAASNEPPILGYQVVLVHEGHTYGNGASNVRDHWEAPALNCFALRSVEFATRKPGESAPHNEAEVTNILLGEPDPTLFSIPQTFVERSPSERHAEFERRFGLHAPTPPQADDVYFSSRQKMN
ncbi:MAG TPA: hypothetical protein VKR60_06545 [Candidatus Sulfotelmatobacter sp.]|nr:hypothetical protein [Candidatus Sulfotelmatobacter sp.]